MLAITTTILKPVRKKKLILPLVNLNGLHLGRPQLDPLLQLRALPPPSVPIHLSVSTRLFEPTPLFVQLAPGQTHPPELTLLVQVVPGQTHPSELVFALVFALVVALVVVPLVVLEVVSEVALVVALAVALVVSEVVLQVAPVVVSEVALVALAVVLEVALVALVAPEVAPVVVLEVALALVVALVVVSEVVLVSALVVALELFAPALLALEVAPLLLALEVAPLRLALVTHLHAVFQTPALLFAPLSLVPPQALLSAMRPFAPFVPSLLPLLPLRAALPFVPNRSFKHHGSYSSLLGCSCNPMLYFHTKM